MPNMSPGSYDLASQITSNAIKAKTDLIGASVALEDGGNLAAVKAVTDLIRGNVYAVSNDVLLSGTDAAGWTDAAYTKSKSFVLPPAGFGIGSIRIAHTLSNSGADTVSSRVYRNGVAVGTERTTLNTLNVNDDVVAAWAEGDTIEIWTKVTGGGIGSLTNIQIRGYFTYGFVQIL